MGMTTTPPDAMGIALASAPALPARRLLDTGPSARGAHRLESALICPALYAFTKVVKHEEALGDRGPLVRGSMGHVALAHHYARLGCVQHQMDPEAYFTPHEAIDLVAAKMLPTSTQYLKLIHDAYDGYRAFYATERHEVVGVEEPADTMVPTPDGPLRFTQRWDLRTRDDAGRVWITDHKFVAKVEAKTVARYVLSIQFASMQWLGHHFFGKDFGGVKLNLIGVGSSRFTFQCASLPPAPDAVRRFPATLAHGERVIAQVEALSDPWDAQRTYSEQVCYTAYGPCRAYALCRWGRGHLTMDGRTL